MVAQRNTAELVSRLSEERHENAVLFKESVGDLYDLRSSRRHRSVFHCSHG